MVTGLDEGDPVPHALDHPGALVTEDTWRVARRVGTRRRVQVRVAHAAGDEPDEDLAGARLGQLHLLHHERPAELLEHGGADLHAAILLGAVSWNRPAASAWGLSRPL